MIDWHSHILPRMDDGSRDVAESISLINMQISQGVTIAVATPHFYANDETVSSFLERRAASFEFLRDELTDKSVEIRLGAEVRYYNGISRLEELKSLRIEDSKLLLLEMPFSKWTEYMIRELIELSGKSGIKIVLAHVERYMSLQAPSVWERLLESGILMQVNASFFSSFRGKRKAISLLKEGAIHLIGSDCHNVTQRPAKIGNAYETIRKKLGDEFITRINEHGRALLEI